VFIQQQRRGEATRYRGSGVQHRRRSRSFEAVTERTGVGIGTLYQRFPTREALFEAMHRRQIEHLVELPSGTPI
jgi:hypothetical protein